MLAFYVWGMQLGSILGLILGGYIAAGPGWRWGCKIVAILSVRINLLLLLESRVRRAYLCLQAFVVILFIFTFDDTLFPRHIFRALNSPLQNAQTTTATGETLDEKIADGGEPQPKSAPPVTRQVTLTEGAMEKPPRTYWEVLSPIHRFPEDKTTWWQYFRRPFVLFFFPNIVCVSGVVTWNLCEPTDAVLRLASSSHSVAQQVSEDL